MKQFLENLVKNVVDNPDSVAIEETTDDQGRITFLISVDEGDMGRVIGKAGKVINAIRTIMRIMAIPQEAHIRVDVKDSGVAPTSDKGAVEPTIKDDEVLVEAESEAETPAEVEAESDSVEAEEAPETPKAEAEPEEKPAK